MFGFTRDDVVGRPVDGLIVPPQLAVEAAEISVSVARGKPVSMETGRTRSDGSPILVSVIASRCSPPCEGYSYYAIYRELVSQRGRRRRWGESTDSGFLTALFEDADEPGLFTDSRGMVNAVNHSFCRQFGWKPGELAGTDLLRTLVPPDMAGAEEEARKMLLGGAIVNTETVILDAYGSRRSTGLTAVPVSLDGGAAGSYRAYCPPALALPENLEVKGKNRFRDPPFSHLPGVFFRVRHDASRTVGFLSRPDLPGSSGRSEPLPRNEGLSWGVHSDDLENLRETLDSSAGTGRPYQITYRMVDPSGERWVLEQGCPDDDRLGFEGYIVDITATKRVEEMVARARRRLEDLHGIAGRLQRSATESEIYRICAEAACSILDADCGMVLVKNGGEVEVAYKTVAHGSHCPEDCHTELASVVLETGKPFSYTSREGHNTGCAFSGTAYAGRSRRTRCSWPFPAGATPSPNPWWESPTCSSDTPSSPSDGSHSSAS
jgi:PAS domain S-box-containing protein